jgi:hypothetical protein
MQPLRRLAYTLAPPRPLRLIVARRSAATTPAPPTRSQHRRRAAAEALLSTLLSWSNAQGVDTSRVGLFVEDDDGYERGILAARPIEKGEALLVVPMRIALVDAAAAPQQPDAAAPFYEGAPWSVRLASRLLRELNAGQRSPWAPYVAALPAVVPAAAATWSWDETRALADARAEAACDRAVLLREDAFERLRDRAAEVWGSVDDSDETVLRERWAWALACVHSRTFLVGTRDGAGARALVPLIDLCNHAGDEAVRGRDVKDASSSSFGAAALRAAARDNVRWDLVKASSGTGREEWALALTALRPLVPGEELLLSYGERENDDFLIHYGFLPQLNPHDDVELFSSASSAAAASPPSSAAEPDAAAATAALREALEEAAEWHWGVRGLQAGEEDEEAAAQRYRAAVEAALRAELGGEEGDAAVAAAVASGGSLRVKAGSRVSPGLVALFAELEGGQQRAAAMLVARRCWQLLLGGGGGGGGGGTAQKPRPLLLRELALLVLQEEDAEAEGDRPFSKWLLPFYYRALVERGLCGEDGAWRRREEGGAAAAAAAAGPAAAGAASAADLARSILAASASSGEAKMSYEQRLATTFRAYKGMILADCVLDAGAALSDLVDG